MPRKRLAWTFYPAYMAITAGALLFVALYASSSMHRFHFRQTGEALEVRAKLLGREIADVMKSGGPAGADRWCKERGRETASRITVVLPSGQVAGDSEDDPAAMDNHSSRPEVAEALAGRVGSATRYSPTLKRTMMYVAVPAGGSGRAGPAVRVSLPLDEVEGVLRSFYAHLALAGLAIAVLAAAAGIVLFRRISLPLEDLRRGAELFAAGDLGGRIPLPEAAEMRDLAVSMNRMAEQLGERLKTLVRQRNEQEAVLMSMSEGVIAVDADERIISVNNAAARMLGLARDSVRGTTIQQAVRNDDLQHFVAEALAATEPREGSVVLRDGETERFFNACGAALRDAEGSRIGAVIVLNDISRIHRLENLRKEFVANVSHELKTPITSIKGYVETLLDGAAKDKEDADRFLGIVAKHADRLNTIIEDLLLLSRLEQDPGAVQLKKEETAFMEVLRDAVEACSAKALEKGVHVEVDCPEDLTAVVNAQLLGQAATNLLDNAIKYSEAGGKVLVAARRDGLAAVVSVQDHGCGIPAEALPRIGERFFRVDKARSRSQGGTGLGLAIVKHIAEVHGGSFSVESQAGKGSVFSIRLPAPA